jgi:protein ImuA
MRNRTNKEHNVKKMQLYTTPASNFARLPSAFPAGRANHDRTPTQNQSSSAQFYEILSDSPGDEITAAAFTFFMGAQALGEAGKTLCFCGPGGQAQEFGQLYGHGLAGLGIEPDRMLMVAASSEKDLLWTLEEAVSSGAFGAVIGSLGAKERLYGFPASRRLKLRAAASQTPLFLLRHRLSGGATAAHGRWRVASMPSRSEGEHAGYQLLGPSRFRLILERMGGLRPQEWEMEIDAARDFDMAALLENRPSRKARRGWHQAA